MCAGLERGARNAFGHMARREHQLARMADSVYNDSAVITVYHLSSSRSERIVWLLEELGLDYRMEFHSRQPTGAAPPAMKAIHALGKAPIIRDGDAVLAESGAIVDYIVHRYAGDRLAVAPAAQEYARYIYWFH